MARSQLYALIRSAGDACAQDSDTALLGRFVEAADQEAFAELVRRYSRLIWGQCRHLLANEADADDAFQATFFALAKSARAIRTGDRLGPWLHAVAYRVCLNSHRAAARRKKRERRAASQEGIAPVADSTWDRAAAALHEEVNKLPESLRVPFVLCCLEGKAPTVAALQLGLKWGTFSARLSRAKQRLLDQLSARGLGAGVIVGAVNIGTVASAAAVERAVQLGSVGASVPASILSLTTGVSGMFLLRTKLSMVLALAVSVVGVATLMLPANNLPTAIPVARAAPVPMESVEVKSKKLEELWKLLIELDDAVSVRALLELSIRPNNDVVRFLGDKLKPIKVTKVKLEKLIGELGDEKGEVVEAAFAELGYFDPRLELDLETIMKFATTKRQKQRVVGLLSSWTLTEANKYTWCEVQFNVTRNPAAAAANERVIYTVSLSNDPNKPAGFQTELDRIGIAGGMTSIVPSDLSELRLSQWNRASRAILVLELLRTPDAIKLLETIATGHPDASPTKAAAEALVRLKKK